jgi:hypothetical protein
MRPNKGVLEELIVRSWCLAIGLIVLMCSGCAAGGAFTVPLTEDTFVSEASPDASFSENATIWATSEGGKPTNEVYLGFENNFNTTGVVLPKNVESAVLKLYAIEVKKPGKITAYLVHEGTYSTTTWNDKVNYDEEANATTNIDKEGEYTLDTTSLIQLAVRVCEGGCPYSIVLVADGDASIGFASMESSDKEKRASLEYTT